MQRVMAAALVGAMGLVAVQAQTPAPSSPPAAAPQAPPAGRGGGRGGPPLVSPEVKPDNTVTFRFRAPNAKLVTLIGELDGKTYPMTRDEAGIWTVTIGPLAQWLISMYGWRAAYLWLGIGTLALLVPLVWWGAQEPPRAAPPRPPSTATPVDDGGIRVRAAL